MMFYRFLNLIVIALFFQIVSFAQTDLKVEIPKQVERIKLISGISEMGYGELPRTSEVNFLPKDNPIQILIDYGMEAVPLLAPYLADNSLTHALRFHSSGWKKQATVSEYIEFIIQRITDHTFDGKYTDDKLDARDYQNQVLVWWKKNHDKSLLERKLEEVNDPIHTNRFSAYEFIGKTKPKKGRELLEKRIEVLLTGDVNSLKQSEMTSCAESLAKIGDVNSAIFIRKVREHLLQWVTDSSGLYVNSYVLSDLFRTFRALSILGFKDEALLGLKDLQTKYFIKMEPYTQKEFSDILKDVEK